MEGRDNDKPPTQLFERWFVGDHSDVGGRFSFDTLNGDALANPPFRWIVWGAARAAANNRRPLLFDPRAIDKYYNVLFYMADDLTAPT
jgi:hypothetical protein